MTSLRFPSLSTLPVACAAVLVAVSAQISPARGDTLTVDGVCTLGDAIEAANTDETTVGGCVDTATGPDTLVLDVDVVLGAADLARSTELEGSFAGLPDVITEITIQAGLGSRIERDGSSDCDEIGPPDEFRLLQVTSAGNLTLDGLVLENGCADDGGAVLVDGGLLEVVDTVFRGNTAQPASSGVSFTARGGALWVGASSVVSIESSTFESNRSLASSNNGFGGAIWVGNGAAVSVDGCTFDGNLAEGSRGQGGALYDAGGLTNLSSSRFLGNRAQGITVNGQGGGAFLASPATLIDLVFDGNVAQGADVPAGKGGNGSAGGLHLEYSASGALTDTIFRHNVARGGAGNQGGNAFAGGLYSDAQIPMAAVTFHDNVALAGQGEGLQGGYAKGGAMMFCELGTVDHLTLSGNLAQGGNSTSGAGEYARGGGVYVDCAPALFRHATLAGNRVVAGLGGSGDGVAEGGGLYADDPISVESSILESNTATVGGATNASDCENSGSNTNLTSLGYNVVGAPGDCAFTATADQTGVANSLLPLGDHGCTTPLPDGTCLPTHPVDLGTPALDAGSCTASMATEDARGLSRPWDAAPIDADDGCDAGAYEARDEDGGLGDGVEDGVDNCPADINADQADADADGVGDVCDVCEGDDVTGDADSDGLCFDRDCDDGDGMGISCWLFGDGFESGDTAAWGV